METRPTPVRRPRPANRRAVLEALASGSLSPAAIMERTGLSESGLRYILHYLATEGLVRRTGTTSQRRVALTSLPSPSEAVEAQAPPVDDPPADDLAVDAALEAPDEEGLDDAGDLELPEDDDADLDAPAPPPVRRHAIAAAARQRPSGTATGQRDWWETISREEFSAAAAKRSIELSKHPETAKYRPMVLDAGEFK